MKGVALVVLALLLPASALAGQGWYLITPPISQVPTESTTGEVDNSAALSKWNQSGAFDTAQECERERTVMKTKAIEDLKLFQQRFGEGVLTKLQTLVGAAMLVGRCIASDDPRLKQ